MPITAAVLLAALLHASWNSLLKPQPDRLGVFALGELVTAVACVAAAPFVPPHRAAWAFGAASGVLHLAYGLLLMRSYEVGDFNQVYPLARGLSPLLVTLAAAVVTSDHLGGTGVAGVLVVSAGLAMLAGRPRTAERQAVGLAAATGVAIAAYTVVDGLGVRRSGTALGYTVWIFAAQGLLMSFAARRSIPPALPKLPLGTLVSVLSVLAYGLVIWAQQRGALGPIAALRETSVIAAAVIGALFFHERLGARRIAASVVVVAGVLLISVY